MTAIRQRDGLRPAGPRAATRPVHGRTDDRPALRIPLLITSAMVIAIFLYQAVFNFLSDGIRAYITAVITLCILGVAPSSKSKQVKRSGAERKMTTASNIHTSCICQC